jgi:uncharacterized protein YneF (UPF0154 family)
MLIILCILALLVAIFLLYYIVTKEFYGKIKDISRNDWMKEKNK